MSLPRLQIRLLLLFVLTTAGLITALYLPLRGALLERVAALERDQVRLDIERVLDALRAEQEALSVVANDYGLWDDTFAYLQAPAPQYIQSNFGGTSLQADRLELVAFIDTTGEEVWSGGYDERDDGLTDVPWAREITEQVLPLGRPSAVQGIMETRRGLTLVATAPVTRTDGSGEPPGTVVMARGLDMAEVQRLAHTTHLIVDLWPLSEPAPSEDFIGVPSLLAERMEPLVKPLSEENVAGFVLLRSVAGDPIAVARIVERRVFYVSGKKDVSALLWTLVLAGVAFSVVTLIGMEWLVIRRVLRLEREVLDISARADHSGRVHIEGSDEIAEMAKGINVMLGALDELAAEAADERQKAEELLLNILPGAIATRLKDGEATIADHYQDVSVLFADLVGFTALASELSPLELVQLLNALFSTFDTLADAHGAEKIKTIGDAYMVVAGLPRPMERPAVALTEMALEMQQAVRTFNSEEHANLAVRIGIHSGPVIAGVIGRRKFIYDLWGDTVNVASRMESTGLAGQVQVTAETAAQLEGRFGLTEREVHVKGKGTMRTFLVDPLAQ